MAEEFITNTKHLAEKDYLMNFSVFQSKQQDPLISGLGKMMPL